MSDKKKELIANIIREIDALSDLLNITRQSLSLLEDDNDFTRLDNAISLLIGEEFETIDQFFELEFDYRNQLISENFIQLRRLLNGPNLEVD